MKKLIGVLLLFISFVANAQYRISQKIGDKNAMLTVGGGLTIKGGLVYVDFPDTLVANADIHNLKSYPNMQITTGDSIWKRNKTATGWILMSGGSNAISADSIIVEGPYLIVKPHNPPDLYDTLTFNWDAANLVGGIVTTLPAIGSNIPVLPGPDWIRAAFYGLQPPLATLTGGVNLELTSLSTIDYTLNWSATRQSNTDSLTTIVVAGITQTFTQPGVNQTVSGTQLVYVPTNTSTTYINTVTSADNQIATASSSFNFFPKRYWFYSVGVPVSADIVAALGGTGELTTTKVKSTQFVATVSGTDKRVSYAYPANLGTLSSIIISGLESIDAFTLTVVSVTNASGFVQNYNVYTTNNLFNNTTITFNSVQ